LHLSRIAALTKKCRLRFEWKANSAPSRDTPDVAQQNVEIVRRALVSSRGRDRRERDPEAILEFLDHTIVWEVRSDLPDAAICGGHEGMKRLFATFAMPSKRLGISRSNSSTPEIRS
jgi:hypothetical protein